MEAELYYFVCVSFEMYFSLKLLIHVSSNTIQLTVGERKDH